MAEAFRHSEQPRREDPRDLVKVLIGEALHVEPDHQKQSDRPKQFTIPSVEAAIQTKRNEDNSHVNFLLQKAADLEQSALAAPQIAAQLRQIAADLRHEAQAAQTVFEERRVAERTASGETMNDGKTSLFTRRAAIASQREIFHRWHTPENGPSLIRHLQDVEDMFVDLSGFNAGNERIGPEQVDDRVRLMADSLIVAARYITTRSGIGHRQETLYPPFQDEQELEDDPAIKLYFPPGSEARAQLDDMARRRVALVPVRLNANGGDELSIRKIFINGFDPESQNVANDFIRKTIRRTTLDKDEPIVTDKPRQLSDAEFNRRKAVAGRVDRLVGMLAELLPDEDSPKIQQIRAFAERLQSTIKNTDYAETILNPELSLVFDFAEVNINLNDAIFLFCRGTNAKGERFYDKDGTPFLGLSNEQGEYDGNKATAYITSLRARAERNLPEHLRQTQEALIHEMEGLLGQDIAGTQATVGEKFVDSFAKKQHKIDTLIAAFTGDAQALFTAAEGYDRMLTKVDSLDAMGILQRIMGHYARRFKPGQQLSPFETQIAQSLGVELQPAEDPRLKNITDRLGGYIE